MAKLALWTSPKSHSALGVVGWVSMLPIQCSFHFTPVDEIISSQVCKMKYSDIGGNGSFGKLKTPLVPPQTLPASLNQGPRRPSLLSHTRKSIGGSDGGPQHYRQPASRHASYNLALGSVWGGVEAGARRRRRGRHSLRVQRGVVGGGGRAELRAAEAGRPQLGGAHRGQPLRGRPSRRSQGPGPSQHDERSAPSPTGPGAPADTCRLPSPRRLTRPAAWRGGRGKPPMDVCGARPDPPSWPAAEPSSAWRSPLGDRPVAAAAARPGAAPPRGRPRPGTAPGPRKASAPGVGPAPGKGLWGGHRLGGDAMYSDGDGDRLHGLPLASLSSSRVFLCLFFFFFFFFSAKLRAAKFGSPAENAALRLAAATRTGSTSRKGPVPKAAITTRASLLKGAATPAVARRPPAAGASSPRSRLLSRSAEAAGAAR